jgi:hypothetical protein
MTGPPTRRAAEAIAAEIRRGYWDRELVELFAAAAADHLGGSGPPLYVVTGQGVADGYVVDKSIVQDASVWNTARLEPLRSQIVPGDTESRLMPVDAYPAVLVTDQHRADRHVVRTWWTRVDRPPPTGPDGFPAPAEREDPHGWRSALQGVRDTLGRDR